MRTPAMKADGGTIFNQSNVKLGGTIMKSKTLRFKFLPFSFCFCLKGEHGTSDLQSRYVCCSRKYMQYKFSWTACGGVSQSPTLNPQYIN